MDKYMAGAVYVVAFLISLACAILLVRGFVRSRMRLLLWSSFFFFALTLDNLILFFDQVIFPTHDLSLLRNGATLLGLLVLNYGLIFESE